MSFQSSNLAGGGGGADGGVLSMGTFGTVPNAVGASIAGTVLTMQPADATHPGELKAADWVTFNAKQAVVLTTNGDTLYYNSGLQRLAKGTDGQILTLASGIPSWAAAAGGIDASLTTGSYFFKGVDNTAGGAGAASDLTITAPAKTSGTGAGGSLTLASGDSFGGTVGKVQQRIAGYGTGVDMVYSAAGGILRAVGGTGTYLLPTYSWATATTSGMSYSAGNGVYLSFVSVPVMIFTSYSGEAGAQLGTAAGTLLPGANNNGGLGYYSGTSLLPFKNAYFGNGVVGIGLISGATTQYSANALLDIQSTTKGVLFPRMTTTQKNAVTAAEGMIVYDLTLHKLAVYTGSAWETVTSI